jgi:hypothetical protein
MGIFPSQECRREIWVDIGWNDRKLTVPLSQLEGMGMDGKTGRSSRIGAVGPKEDMNFIAARVQLN